MPRLLNVRVDLYFFSLHTSLSPQHRSDCGWIPLTIKPWGLSELFPPHHASVSVKLAPNTVSLLLPDDCNLTWISDWVRNNLPYRRLPDPFCASTETGFRCLRCSGGSSTPPPALLGSDSGTHTHTKKKKSVYTDSSHYLLLSLPLSWLFLWFAVLGGALNPPFYSAHQLISPPIYPSHNELLCLHYVPVLLHQPGGEAPARLETRGWGGEVGGKGRGLSGEETEEEERGDGGTGESPQLSRAAQWVSRRLTLSGCVV